MACPSTASAIRVAIPGTNAWLTTQQLSALQAGIDSGGYTVRVLAQNVAGQDHVAVVLGERHEKGAHHAVLGQNIVRSFPRRACESVWSPWIEFGGMIQERFFQWVAKPFVVLKSLLGIAFKKRFFGSTIECSEIEAGYFFDSTSLRRLRSALSLYASDTQEAIRYRVSLQQSNYQREVVVNGKEIRTFLCDGPNPIVCEPIPLCLEDGDELTVYDKLSNAIWGALGCLTPPLWITGGVSVLCETQRALESRAGEFSAFDNYVTIPIATSYAVALFLNILWLVPKNCPHRDQTMARNLAEALSQESPEPILAVVGMDHSAGIVEKSRPIAREVELPRRV